MRFNSVTISLAFTSTCRQKKCHVTHHVKLPAIHQNFINTISCTFADNLMTYTYASDNSQPTYTSYLTMVRLSYKVNLAWRDLACFM